MSQPNIDIAEFQVVQNKLRYQGKQIAEFPSDVCELARLDDKIFVVLDGHTTPPDMLYAGCNLWALDLSGKLLWKAQQLNKDFYERSLYLKNSTYPSFSGEYYHNLHFTDISNPKILTWIGRDEILLIDLETGQHIRDKEIREGSDSKIFFKFQKVKNARGANLRATRIDWPEALKATDRVQVILKMKQATMSAQIDLIKEAVKNINPEVLEGEALDKIRINFQSYCQDRMNTYYGREEAPIDLRQLPELIDAFFIELGITMPPRGPYYGWPSMKHLPLKNPKNVIE